MNFVTVGFVKPGTDNSNRKLPKSDKDVIVFWGGTPDISKNNAKRMYCLK
jgi:hypothetical protein